jgi:carbamoyltransferase
MGKTFWIKKRKEDEILEQHHCNLGYAIQQVTEEIVMRMAKRLNELRNQITLLWLVA